MEQWMPSLRLPLSWEQYWQLPRNPAYKYEYLDATAHLTPQPKYHHALLELSPFQAAAAQGVRQFREDDLTELETVFAAAFHDLQPYAGLGESARVQAAQDALQRTMTGGDGPLVAPACFVAVNQGHLIGAILITLLPEGDPDDWDSYHWREPPPGDLLARVGGRPHLTWIFVAPWLSGRGLGTTLLASSAQALLALGYTQLASTFMLGNHSSMLWHWRVGFRLLSHSLPYRRFRLK